MDELESFRYQNIRDYKYNLKRERSIYFIQFYRIIFTLFIRPTPKFFSSWRCYIYRFFGAKIGKKVKVSSSAKLMYPWNIEIGDYCWIGNNVELYSVDKIVIGHNVAISHNTFVATAAHDVGNINFNTIRKAVIIKDEVWISSNVFINMGVVIEKGVVVGSGSIVTKDLPEGYICFGNPAKPVKSRI